ncbi:DUF1616 domain-containing protein [Halomicroarcula sp. GCM10025817]|uniref:DUF1616 domain-containing protein n=1 Tax=Haloarcula TaxID=2237 RepID=UPI0023E867AE|nr:DUF1616 domain-containing protein [Halomicroarcula sp. SYNS111]
MSLRERVRPYLPDRIRTLPIDLALVLGAVVLTAVAVSVPIVRVTPLRAVVSFPFLLVAPGYAFVAALFPEGTSEDSVPETVPQRGLSNLARLAYSLGASVALVPLIGFALNLTPWGLHLWPLLTAISLFTVVCVSVAARRRAEVPPDVRYDPPVDRWVTAVRDEFLAHETRTDTVLNVALVVVLLFAMTSVGYALVDQQSGAEYTEFYLLSRSSDGTLVADDYPTEFVATQSRTIVVGVDNQERDRTTYTVVTALHRVESDSGQASVAKAERLDQYSVTLSPGEVSRQVRVLEPTLTGERLRLTFMLYRGDPPTQPRMDTAYRSTHLWVNVSASDT